MFLTTHAAAGILISQHVSNPVAVFWLAFLSHFLLDFIPHGDEHIYHDQDWKVNKKYRRVVLINLLDVGLVVSTILWLVSWPTQLNVNHVLLGIIGGVLPDFLNHFFPVIHQRFSWLFLMRWLYQLSKPTGLRYFVRGQNWFHNLLHHEIIRSDVPFIVGLSVQVALTALMIYFAA